MVKDAEFTWGDVVTVINDLGCVFPKDTHGCICGITLIDNDRLAEIYSQSIDTYIYTVEFPNGTTCSVPESQLQIVLEE